MLFKGDSFKMPVDLRGFISFMSPYSYVHLHANICTCVCAFSALACYSFVLCVSMFPSVLVSFFFLQEKAFLAGEQVSF